NPLKTANQYSVLGYHYFDIVKYATSQYQMLTKSKVDDTILKEGIKAKNDLEVGANNYNEGQLKGKNLVNIQVESLETFVINLEVEGQAITPNLNRLLANSYYFSNVVTQTDLGNSSDADFLANTSFLPIYRGSISYRFADNSFNSLPNILGQQGYTSYAIHSGQPYFWNKEKYLPNLGFDYIYDINGLDQTEMFFLGLSDQAHLKQIAAKINEISKEKDPFYLYTVTETSHTPFELPKEMQYLDLSEQLNNSLFGKYFQSVRYTDQAIGDFIKQLEEDGTLNNTVIVFYGDHEGVHKYNSIKKLKQDSNDYQKYENNERIPLIIYNPEITGQEITKVGAQVDIMPTTLSLFGIESNTYINSIIGKNIFSNTNGYALSNDGQVITDKPLKEEVEILIREQRTLSEDIIYANYMSSYYHLKEYYYYNDVKKERSK
ncbi:MAG: LTA synthase family protein, partial [Bacilli bacterium]